MKKTILTLVLSFIGSLLFAQYPSGKVVVDQLYSEALENPGGEDPTRRVTVYLPPGYDSSDERYPVVYYLHGFTLNDSISFGWFNIKEQLDKAIAQKKIDPFIFVMNDQRTSYLGSFYTNSTLTGNWSDFTAKDLVDYVDETYRTIPQSDSRGIAGWSMGGFGAIRLGMLHPEVFSSVYSLSPGLGLAEEFGIHGKAYKIISETKSREELLSNNTVFTDEFYAEALVAMGRAISPNPDNPPFYADFPYTYEDGQLVVNYEVLEDWNESVPLGLADKYIDNLKKLKAIKLDWGRNEENDFIPATCREFSEKLENLGIEHYAEEFIGTHGNKLWTNDGRILNDMLPFFNTYLQFEDTASADTSTKK